MCSDWSFLYDMWLVAAVVTSVATIVGARSLYTDKGQSSFVRRVSVALGAAAPLVFATGLGFGIKAAMRANTLHFADVMWVIVVRSRSMNVASVLVALACGLSLALMRRRAAGEWRVPVLVLAVLAVTSGLLGAATMRAQDDLCEAFAMVREIQIAQEAYRAETGAYANVSVALAANQATRHEALYPSSPSEPNARSRLWNVPCPASVCKAGSDWAMLPVHVDAPVVFGYSTIAGRAGERPVADVTLGGKRVQWPVPERDWYIVTAVGDPSGSGTFVTVVASSFAPHPLVDRGRE